MYGNVDSDGEFSGNDVAYIFPDLSTVISGKFEKGVLVEGRARKVKGFRYNSSIILYNNNFIVNLFGYLGDSSSNCFDKGFKIEQGDGS